MPDPAPAAPRARPPWAAVAGWAVAAAALVAGVPVFLRMPPWCDLTLYDVAAENLLRGGVHYRDVFDTNLPGFVWALAAIRAAFGWSYEAVRAVDLVVVAGVVALLDRLAARAGADRVARAWAVAGAAAFYPFTTEFNHCQRDVWMTLPALAAVALRGRRLMATVPSGDGATALAAAVEGVLWGLAVWFKPHVVVPAALVWLLTVARLPANRRLRTAAVDGFGMLGGAASVGAVGVAALVATGTWPAFVEVFTFWNAGYAAVMWHELASRGTVQLHYFPPWSYFQLLSVPAAVLMILDARPWSCRPPDGPGPVGRLLPGWLWDAGGDGRTQTGRLVLAAVYLGWVAQAFFLQRGFHYVHVPETLMGLAVLAAQRWPAGAVGVGWLAAGSLVVGLGWVRPQDPPPVRTSRPHWGVVFTHPVADPGYAALWVDCWRPAADDGTYYRRRMAAARVKNFHGAIEWVQMAEVAADLRRRGAGDGDVITWHDAPHAVYRLLGARPGLRFQHVSQMLGVGNAQAGRIQAELDAAAPHARWAVSDLMRVAADDDIGDPSAAGPDLLPPGMPPVIRATFPYDRPAVFRSGGGHGRYVVHDLRAPPIVPVAREPGAGK